MLLFILGMAMGALLALGLLAQRRASSLDREREDVDRARRRLRALQAAALSDLADVVQMTPRSTSSPATSTGSSASCETGDDDVAGRWPSS